MTKSFYEILIPENLQNDIDGENEYIPRISAKLLVNKDYNIRDNVGYVLENPVLNNLTVLAIYTNNLEEILRLKVSNELVENLRKIDINQHKEFVEYALQYNETKSKGLDAFTALRTVGKKFFGVNFFDYENYIDYRTNELLQNGPDFLKKHIEFREQIQDFYSITSELYSIITSLSKLAESKGTIQIENLKISHVEKIIDDYFDKLKKIEIDVNGQNINGYDDLENYLKNGAKKANYIYDDLERLGFLANPEIGVKRAVTMMAKGVPLPDSVNMNIFGKMSPNLIEISNLLPFETENLFLSLIQTTITEQKNIHRNFLDKKYDNLKLALNQVSDVITYFYEVSKSEPLKEFFEFSNHETLKRNLDEKLGLQEGENEVNYKGKKIDLNLNRLYKNILTILSDTSKPLPEEDRGRIEVLFAALLQDKVLLNDSIRKLSELGTFEITKVAENDIRLAFSLDDETYKKRTNAGLVKNEPRKKQFLTELATELKTGLNQLPNEKAINFEISGNRIEFTGTPNYINAILGIPENKISISDLFDKAMSLQNQLNINSIKKTPKGDNGLYDITIEFNRMLIPNPVNEIKNTILPYIKDNYGVEATLMQNKRITIKDAPITLVENLSKMIEHSGKH